MKKWDEITEHVSSVTLENTKSVKCIAEHNPDKKNEEIKKLKC
jgi:hypothetical protein